jgi:processive 1,2-diacylglycerol beta-glucosyltransferase
MEKEVCLTKILVFYASIGSGHKKAAEAIVTSLRSEGGVEDVFLIDALSLMNPMYRNLVPWGYIWLAKYFPSLLGFLYRISDQSFSLLPPVFFLRSLFSRLFSSGFSKFIRDASPDIIICTHFLPMELLTQDLMDELSPLLFVSVTDILPHAFWVAPGVERYFVASRESLNRLNELGVQSEKVSVSGIPVHPVFHGEATDKTLGRYPDNPLNLLVVGGGAGVAPIEKLLVGLSKSLHPVSVTVVTGSNRALFRRIFLKREDFPFPLIVRGYTKRMSQFMEKSDFVATKPGGLTTAECLAMGRPMLLFAPIPGQEEDNRDVLEAWGVAKSLSNVQEASSLLDSLIMDRKMFFSLQERAKERGRSNASSVVCQEVLCSLHKARRKEDGKSFPGKLSKFGRMAFSKWF